MHILVVAALLLTQETRRASAPYFAGPDGVTPEAAPGVFANVGAPGSSVPGFTPDLVDHETRLNLAFLVRL